MNYGELFTKFVLSSGHVSRARVNIFAYRPSVVVCVQLNIFTHCSSLSVITIPEGDRLPIWFGILCFLFHFQRDDLWFIINGDPSKQNFTSLIRKAIYLWIIKGKLFFMFFKQVPVSVAQGKILSFLAM